MIPTKKQEITDLNKQLKDINNGLLSLKKKLLKKYATNSENSVNENDKQSNAQTNLKDINELLANLESLYKNSSNNEKEYKKKK